MSKILDLNFCVSNIGRSRVVASTKARSLKESLKTHILGSHQIHTLGAFNSIDLDDLNTNINGVPENELMRIFEKIERCNPSW